MSGSKLNKNKTKGLWLGAWKDRKDNYKFGIDFVECIKIVGFKIGNNIRQDDIWHPIYVRFEKVLKMVLNIKHTITVTNYSLALLNVKCLQVEKYNY
jgi:hypothetical protein